MRLKFADTDLQLNISAKFEAVKKERTLSRKRRGIYREGTCNIQKTRFWGENRVYGDIDCWQFAELYQRVDDLLEESHFEIVTIVGPRKKAKWEKCVVEIRHNFQNLHNLKHPSVSLDWIMKQKEGQ